jgi:WD40 repeat protein
MRLGACLSALLVIGLAWKGEDNHPKKPNPPVDTAAIDKLIAQLGADSFQEREEALRRLIAVGPPALGALRRIADDKQVDPDVRLRAARAVYAIAMVKIEMVRCLGEHMGQPNDVSSHWARRVALSPDGKHAATAGWDNIRYWDLASGKLIRAFGTNKQGYWALSFSADGRHVIAGGSNVYLFDVNTGKLLHEMTGHTQSVWGALLTADGKQALSGGWDNSIRVWDTATGKEIRAFKGVQDKVRCLALSPDGKLLAGGHFAVEGGPGVIRLWDVAKGTEIRTLKGHEREVTSVHFSADGKLLLSSSFDKTLRLWRVADGTEIKRLKNNSGCIEEAVFTPDGRRIVSCGWDDDPTLRLWDVSSGKLLGVSEPLSDGLPSVAVLPDGRHALTTGKDGAVRLWRWER